MASPTGIVIPSIQSGIERTGMDTGAASPQMLTPQLPSFGAGTDGEFLGWLETMKQQNRLDGQSAD